jgi:hypothetical protein
MIFAIFFFGKRKAENKFHPHSYPPELVRKTKHALKHHGWTPSDYIISFNGCGSVLGGEFCVEAYGHYFTESMKPGGGMTRDGTPLHGNFEKGGSYEVPMIRTQEEVVVQ